MVVCFVLLVEILNIGEETRALCWGGVDLLQKVPGEMAKGVEE